MGSKKKKNELKDASIQSLQEVLLQLDRDIFVLRNELAWNQKIEKPHRLKQMKKEKARILTFLTIKQKSQTKERGG